MTQQNQLYQQARLSRDRRFDGQFFVAVKSTGIFCRNICPAKTPKEENVEYFDFAAQAVQQGYRPCLRCRPDSAPNSYAWLGTETTLIRAMRLLRSRPEDPLPQIADSLGISDGYLRKLFRQKLGITPKHYQLTEQLLFAKKLLHESDMTVEQVAANCGFQSSRRLQDNMQRLLQLTPSQIRKQQQAVSSQLELFLPVNPPYCWPQVRDFLAKRAISGVECVSEDSYSRSYNLAGSGGFFAATYLPGHAQFKVTLACDQPSQVRAVIQNIQRVLDMQTDYPLIAKALQKVGIAQSELLPGLRLPGVWDLFEAGCRAILGQQVSVTAAVNQVTKLSQALGSKATGLANPDLNHCFPTPAQVAASELEFIKLPGARKAALRSFALHMAQCQLPDDFEQWLAIKGIGPWTVSYAKMRGLSDPDVWMGGDLVIKKQIQDKHLQPDAASPWRSYLTFQLWSNAS